MIFPSSLHDILHHWILQWQYPVMKPVVHFDLMAVLNCLLEEKENISSILPHFKTLAT